MQGQTTLVLVKLFLAFVFLASGATDVATRMALMDLKRTNAEFKRHYAELKKHFADVKRDNAELKEHYAEVKRDNAEVRRHYTEVTNGNSELKRDNAELKEHYAEVKRDNVELKRDNTELKRDNTELKRDNAELKTDNAEIKRDNTELKRDNAQLKKAMGDLKAQLSGTLEVRQVMASCGHDNATTSKSGQSTSGGGATYIRWGRTSCPAESNLVYKGYVGGSHYTKIGAATNDVCLPENPQYTTTVLPKMYAEMWGAEYESYNVIFRSDIFQQDIPCAVCRSPTRSSAIMIPARTSCYRGLHREYSGYLMAGWPSDNAGSEYICVDGDPETLHGGASNQDGDVLYFTVSRCGSLKCPPYVEKRVLSCVVCSQ